MASSAASSAVSSLAASLSALSVNPGALSHHHHQHHQHHNQQQQQHPHPHHPHHSSSTSSSSSNHHDASAGYDWSSEDNLSRWRGIFAHPLEKVLRQVHPSLVAQEDALHYVEDLILRLLAMLTAKPIPVTVADIEDKVSKTFPTPIDKWALTEAQAAVEKGKKKSSLVLPVDKVHPMLREVLQNKVDEHVTLFLVAVLENISADIFKLAGNYVKNIRHVTISCQDIKVAMCADKVLMDMFQQDSSIMYVEEDSDQKKSQTYDEVVKDLIMDEKQYLRDLYMITKVFREIMQKDGIGSSLEIDAIFSNITDITELTTTLISSLEDTLEMTEESNVPAVGPCFFELAEAMEFNHYDEYARDILSQTSRKTLDSLLPKQIVSEALRSCGKGFREAVKFYLPKLLLGPIYHCFQYFNYIELLRKLTPSKEERDTLTEVASMLTPLKNKLKLAVQNAGPAAKRKPGDISHRLGHGRTSRQQSLQKLSQLQQSIANWEGPDLSSQSSEIVCDGKLKVIDKSKKLVDRYVILCDGIILVCKQLTGKRSSVSSFQGYEYRLREKHLIRRVDVLDRDDASGEKFTFELAPRDQPKIVFKAESEDEKNSWMAALVMLNTKFMLERLLDVILLNEEKKHPLKFPSSDRYVFTEPDSENNIVFEKNEKSSVPLIKGATLVKLVERLTYHIFADPMFMKTFLTTYRSFCTPHELLDLLITRFNIPEPEFSSDSESDSEGYSDAGARPRQEQLRIAQDLKRFRTQYSQPVQFRVLNVLKHWVDQHYYDFEQDAELLLKLEAFLQEVSGKSMRKWVDSISKIVKRRLSHDEKEKDIIFSLDRSPPPIEHHIDLPEEDWPELLTYHPIEIARQLTLLEFQYYRAVKPSELVDQAWTREDKDKRSPNLLRMVRHTTNFTRYLEKLIVETENLEERVAVMQRTLEIMMVLQEYNNFNGVLAITSAINSSAVHRLAVTKDRIPNHLLKALEEASSYIQDHFRVYWDKLRSINPPCVPFFGQYQTNILFLEEGNPDFLHNSNLINFTKRRKVAEIISEIQQYQNQPYCLSVFEELKTFIEGIDPFPELTEKEVTDYLWTKSTEIEPRNVDPSQKKKLSEGKIRWKGLNLRSPGIKPKNLPGRNHPHPLPRLRTPSKHTILDGVGVGGFRVGSVGNSDHDAGTASDSPLTSPIGRNSPMSGPSTPVLSSSAASASSPPDSDPIKVPVILPAHASPGPMSAAAPPLPPSSVPPPLPPKPVRHSASSATTSAVPLPPHRQPHGAVANLPPVPMRQSSPPPPPLPPRRDHPHQQRHSTTSSSSSSTAAPAVAPPPPPSPAAGATAASWREPARQQTQQQPKRTI